MELNLCMGCMETLSAPGPCPHCGFDENTYMTPPYHLPPSTILKGRYLLGKALAEGGFGITYVAWDLNQEQKVAIKEYFPHEYVRRENTHSNRLFSVSGEKEGISRHGLEKFVEEAQYLIRYQSHPGVVKTTDWFRENNTAYIVMEFLQGSLKQMFAQNGPLSAETIFPMMRPVMDALQEIHKANLIHRDISPDNIMFDSQRRAKLIDFGAARFFDPDDEKSLSIVLKYRYAPPEQYQRHGHQGPWTDVYSLCATIYHVITGTAPIDAMGRMNGQELKAPSQLGIPISSIYEAALMKGLALKHQERFQTMEELKTALFHTEPTIQADPTQIFNPFPQNPDLSQTISKSEKETQNTDRTFKLLWGAFAGISVLLILFFLTATLVMVNMRQSEKEEEPGTSQAAETSEKIAETEEDLTAKPSAPDVLPPNSAEDDGNLFGNAHCYARIISDGTYLYFRNSLDDERTYWIKKGETEEHLLTNVLMKDLHYKDDWIYYSGNSTPNNPSDDHNIYRMRNDGSEITNLTNLTFANPQSLLSFETMAGGKCFFYYSDGNGLTTDIGYVPESGGTPTFLARIPGSNAPDKGFCLNVIGDKVYYLAKDGLHCVDINTRIDQMALSGFSCDEYLIYDGAIYFSTTAPYSGTYATLERINLDGTGRKELFASPLTNVNEISLHINLYQGKIYFLLTGNMSEVKTVGRLYTCDLNGSGCQMLLDDVSWFNIIDHGLYYRYVDMHNIGDEKYSYAPYYYIPFSSLIEGNGLQKRKELFDVTPYKK